jgi:hypothetical protein
VKASSKKGWSCAETAEKMSGQTTQGSENGVRLDY